MPIESAASPEQVAHLVHGEPGFIWLDGNGTRSLVCRDPAATLVSDGERVMVRGLFGAVELPAPSFDVLAAALRAWQGTNTALLAGFLGYDLAGDLEDVAPGNFPVDDFPRFYFGLYDCVLRHDSEGWRLDATSGWRDSGPGIAEARRLLERASSLSLPHPDDEEIPAAELRTSDEAFLEGVKGIVQRIHRGEFFQTNLCRALTAEFPATAAWPLYRRMRRSNPAKYAAFLNPDSQTRILSMSPELFLRTENNAVESCPIKGTRPRDSDPFQDESLRADLLSDAKDGAELAMIVDVTRNDLSRVCQAGSVRVIEHRSLLNLPSLYHTYSRIEGCLKPGVTMIDLLRATFPPASITGAPKIAAVQAALQEEGEGRGPCMGSIGWISLTGEMELSVAIRTAYVHKGRIRYLAGCGITAESDPSRELAESQAKAASFVAALGKHTALGC
ncbi:MAG: anthranilate synthase component I family protein [Acidobacteriota bacterium]|nr:anthranilate synthase component I family protein [Acidobacteriota bacterium]